MRGLAVLSALARQGKHAGFMVRKRSRKKYLDVKFEATTRLFRDVESWAPYVYRPARYRHTFLRHDVVPQGQTVFPARVFAVWAGNNELTPARRRNLERLKSGLGLPLVLVTPENLPAWIVDGHPLHPGYEHLALMHRADYLRAYLMHHHGGGYVDIKAPRCPWSGTYADMSTDADAWVTSYGTIHTSWIGKLRGRLGFDILVRYRLMFGKSGFMMRSQTPLTAEWLTEVEGVLDSLLQRLQAAPATHPYGGPGYPLSWHDLLARVLDPLTLKHQNHVRIDDRMLLEFENYR